jgi:hypothetical protein
MLSRTLSNFHRPYDFGDLVRILFSGFWLESSPPTLLELKWSMVGTPNDISSTRLDTARNQRWLSGENFRQSFGCPSLFCHATDGYPHAKVWRNFHILIAWKPLSFEWILDELQGTKVPQL